MRWLLFWLLPACAAAQLRIDAKNFGAPEKEIRAILSEVIGIFPEQEIPPLFVTRSENGPITLYEKSLRGEVIIQLSTRGRYWSQYIYQFAHELMHVRMGFYPENRENKWLDETFCETASLFVLRQLSVKWNEAPPYEAWKEYAHKLSDYADKIIASRNQLKLPELKEFYVRHREQLRKSPKHRTLNGAMAGTLLPLFEEQPKRWMALRFLNKTRPSKEISLEEHFAHWKTAAKDDAFVEKLRNLFL